MIRLTDFPLRALARSLSTNGPARLAPVVALAVLFGGCTTVSINSGDTSAPQVKIFLMKDLREGNAQEATSVSYSNSTAQEPVEVLCSVYDPQGVRTVDLRVSDATVDSAYCGGAIYPGSFFVGGLPGPDQASGWVGSGTTRKQLYGFLVISGILPLATNPAGVPGPCFPANNSTITVRCRGRNWSASSGSSTTDKELQVKFSF